MQTVCASGSNFLPQCVEGASKVHVLLIRCSQRLLLEGGGEILREINGQDHQTSMAKISASICSIWSRSLRSSECIGKQCSRHQQYVVENHKNIKQGVFGQTVQVHILLENLAYNQRCRLIDKPH